MCVLTEMERSIQARIPINIIYTTDAPQVLRDVTEYLRDNSHYLWVWGPILGHKETNVRDTWLEFDATYRSDSTGDPTSIMNLWIEELQKTTELYRVTRDGSNQILEVDDGERLDDKLREGEAPRRTHKTLVLMGSEIWLSPDNPDYDPLSEQALWEIAQFNSSGHSNICLIVPSGTRLGEKISSIATNIEDKLPDRHEFSEEIWPTFITQCPQALTENLGETQEIKSSVVDRLCGLSRPVARNALTTSIINVAHAWPKLGGDIVERRRAAQRMFLDSLGKVKENSLRRSGALELLKPMPKSSIGGLRNLIAWVEKRKNCFTDEARERHIAFPKGILLVGPPGTGKTHTAKTVASILDLPLLRGDLGALFGGLVGQSESNTRTFLDTVEAMSPCVLLIDEIEKGLGGAGGNSTDGGTTQRVFGTILSWMQDRDPENPVFVVATANDISRLPPELLRKGRFDEIWFVDLPSGDERADILQIHLTATKDPDARMIAEWENHGRPNIIREAVEKSEGFVGAELAQAVIEAQIDAFSDGERFSIEHLVAAIEATKPLSVTMSEQIENVRAWATARARPASKAPTQRVKSQDRNLGPGDARRAYSNLGG